MALFSKARHARSDDSDLDPTAWMGPIPVDDTTSRSGANGDAPVAEAEVLTQKERDAILDESPRDAAKRMGIEYIPSLEKWPVNPDAVNVEGVTEELCRRYSAIPIDYDEENGSIVIVMTDPRNVLATDDFAHATSLRVLVKVAEKNDVAALINRSYKADAQIEKLTESLALNATENASAVDESVFVDDQNSPIAQFVQKIIDQAINSRASDIHIEPREKELVVRFRIDGVLHVMYHVPRTTAPQILSRIKVLSAMDIGEHRIPQDGRLRAMYAGKSVDLRVAALPTVYGEKITMRILDAPVSTLTLENLGMLPGNMTAFEKGFRRPFGMVLVTGPTGSGKSTTLYTTLNAIANDGVNVITVEDPVEYRLDGINQVQVNAKAGMTFAAALRSILRSDPDVVLIGEIRDKETATIAIEAALTGHLVLSTLHTNDAPSTATRLIEMGVEPFLVSQALSCVVAQRLVRRLCSKCKRSTTMTAADLEDMGMNPEEAANHDGDEIYEPVGCAECSNTGYRGRLAIHEVMLINGTIEKLISSSGTTDEISTAAMDNGMTRLRHDCLEKVLRGDTSMEETRRVTTVA